MPVISGILLRIVFMRTIRSSMKTTPKDVLSQLIRERRSCRKFSHNSINVQEITQIFEDIRFMPCPTNRQCFRFLGFKNPLKIQAMRQEIVTEVEAIAQKLDPGDADTFRKYAEFFTFFDKAPYIIVGLYRTFVSRLPSGDSKADSIQGLAEVQAFGGAVTALLLSLHARRYSACWMTGPLIAENRILRLLEVEDPWRLGAVIPVGVSPQPPECPKKPITDKVFSSVFEF